MTLSESWRATADISNCLLIIVILSKMANAGLTFVVGAITPSRSSSEMAASLILICLQMLVSVSFLTELYSHLNPVPTRENKNTAPEA